MHFKISNFYKTPICLVLLPYISVYLYLTYSTFDIRQFICIRRRHIIMVSILVRVGLPVSRLSSFFLLSITVFLILKISYFYNWVTEIKDVKMFSFFTIHYLTSIQKIYNSLTKWSNKNWRHDTFITYGNIW